jgi:hypothetical protein
MALIPLGIWAASGASSGGGADFQLISTQTIATSGTMSVTFSSIASTYRNLQVRMTVCNNANFQSVTQVGMRFNSDSGSNYAYHLLYGNGSSVVSTGSSTQTDIRLTGAGDISSGTVYGSFITDVLDYTVAKNKTIGSLNGTTNQTYYKHIGLNSGVWQSTSAVTSLELREINGYGFRAGSRFSLYGWN